MAQLRKRVRLANPRRKRRNLSAKQIKFFGTKRQKAALKAARTRKRKATPRRRNSSVARGVGVRGPRRPNVGVIYSIGLNPGKEKGKSNMARRKRRTTAKRRVYRRRRGNPARAKARTRTITRYRTRRNPRRKVARRRRNPNMSIFSGTARQVVGVIGGAAVTKLIVDRLPYGLNVGIPGYIATAVVAVVQGWAVGKFGKQQALGTAMQLGGFTYLGLRILEEFFPSLASVSPFGLRGMGVIGPSSFYVPQVPSRNMMTSFVRPSAIPAPVVTANGMAGLGRRVPRMGRFA